MGHQIMKYKKQCRLAKGDRRISIWIPEEFAVKGKQISVDKVKGWFVQKVFDKRVSSEYLKERERDYLNTRKASDI